MAGEIPSEENRFESEANFARMLDGIKADEPATEADTAPAVAPENADPTEGFSVLETKADLETAAEPKEESSEQSPEAKRQREILRAAHEEWRQLDVAIRALWRQESDFLDAADYTARSLSRTAIENPRSTGFNVVNQRAEDTKGSVLDRIRDIKHLNEVEISSLRPVHDRFEHIMSQLDTSDPESAQPLVEEAIRTFTTAINNFRSSRAEAAIIQLRIRNAFVENQEQAASLAQRVEGSATEEFSLASGRAVGRIEEELSAVQVAERGFTGSLDVRIARFSSIMGSLIPEESEGSSSSETI